MKFKYQSNQYIEPYYNLTDLINEDDNKKHIVFQVLNNVTGDSRVIKTAESAKSFGYRVTILGMSRTEEDVFTVVEGLDVILLSNPAHKINKQKSPPPRESYEYYELLIKSYFESAKDIFQDLKPNLLHTHDIYGIELGFLFLNHLSVLGTTIPWVHDIHEYVAGLDHVPHYVAEYCLQAEEKRIFSPDALFTVTEMLADKLTENYKLSKRPIVLKNSPRISDFDSEYSQTLRKKIGLASSDILGVYVGRINKVRGIHNLIELLKHSKKINFAIVTNQQDQFRVDCESYAESLGVEDRLFFVDYVDSSEVSSFIQDADFGISPLLRYGNAEVSIPTKVSEYLHAGIPIVTSDTDAMVRFIEETRVGVVFKSNSVDSLAKAIDYLLKNYDLFKANITDEIKYIYSWDYSEPYVDSVYKDLLEIYEDRSLYDFNPKYKIENLRVFHGLSGGANQPFTITRGLRKIGFKVADNAHLSPGNKMGYGRDFELIDSKNIRNVFFYLTRLSKKYDLFHYHFRSLYRVSNVGFPTGLDILLLKATGKIVIMSFRGSEVRLHSKFKEVNKYNYVDENPNNLTTKFPESEQTRFIDFCTATCDEIIVSDPEMLTYVPNAKIVPRAIDLSLYSKESLFNFTSEKEWHEEGPLIVHIPSREAVKGSKYIEKAVQDLKNEGIKFRFKFIKDVSHEEVITLYSEADIVIDQLRIGWYGVASVEAMSLGRCTIAYIREDIQNYLSEFNYPIVSANPDSIKDVLLDLINDRDRVVAQGAIARDFVENYHCQEKVVAKYKSIYESVYKSPKEADLPVLNSYLLSMMESVMVNNSQLKKMSSRNISYSNLIKEYKKQITQLENEKRNVLSNFKYFFNDGSSNKQIFDKPLRKSPFRIMKKLGIKK